MPNRPAAAQRTVQLKPFMAGLLVRNAKFERTTHARVRPPGLLSLRGVPRQAGPSALGPGGI